MAADRAPAPVRLALLGLGWVVDRIWTPMLDGHDGFRVVAVLDPNAEAVDRVRKSFPDARVLSAAADLDPAEVDLAVVAVPNHLHAELATGLLRRGISVFVEKPVVLDSAEAAELAEAERAGGARVLAGTAAWHRADVKALRANLSTVGPIRTIDLSWVRAKGVPAPGSWFTRGERSGGGALFDLGWHLVTVGLRMIDWPVLPQVVGSVSADFLSSADVDASWQGRLGPVLAPTDVEDTAHACFRTDTNVLVTLRAAWASHTDLDRTRIAVEGARGRLELLCTFGFSPHRVPVSRLLLRRDGLVTEIEVPAEPVGAEYRRQLDLLPALLADPGQPGAATAETARVVHLIERIYRSAGVAAARPAPLWAWR